MFYYHSILIQDGEEETEAPKTEEEVINKRIKNNKNGAILLEKKM